MWIRPRLGSTGDLPRGRGRPALWLLALWLRALPRQQRRLQRLEPLHRTDAQASTRASTTTADRYYDPELARFIQADSIVPDPEFAQAYNRYTYVYNNPLKFTDPTGQFPWLIVAAIAISGGVAAATGGNPIQAMVMTALGMALFAGIGGVISQMGVVGPVTTAVIAGAATGAIMSGISGGNPLVGAAIGAGSIFLIRGVLKIDPGLWDTMPQEQAFGEWMATQVVSLGIGGAQGASPKSLLFNFAGDATLQVAVHSFHVADPKDVGPYGSSGSTATNTGDRSGSGSGLQKAGATALAITLVTPIPGDEAVVLAGIGAIAGTIAVMTAVKTVDWDGILTKMWTDIARVLGRPPKTRMGEMYSLRATKSGYYPDFYGRKYGIGLGLIHLNRGDVWKYGETVQGSARYTKGFYRLMGLRYVPEFSGTKTQCVIAEKAAIAGYKLGHGGRRPPGNLIDR